MDPRIIFHYESTAIHRPLAYRLSVLGAWLLLILGLVISTYSARQHILDDTFIHLRYARNFAATGQVFYNPRQPGSGTSSFLYMLLLSLVGRALPESYWPLMAKTISVAAYFAAVAMLLGTIPRQGRAGARRPLLVAAVAMMMAVPSATRWMQDGMETSLAVLFAIAAARAAGRWRSTPEPKWWPHGLLIGLFISLPFILRIDGALITMAACGLCLLRPRKPAIISLLVTTFVVVSVWALILHHFTGSIVPDTAIAKRSGSFSFEFLIGFVLAMSSVSPLWLLPMILFLFQGFAPSRKTTNRVEVFALAMMPIVVTVAGGMAVGQLIQGARYFLPPLAFAWVIWLQQDIHSNVAGADGAMNASARRLLAAGTLIAAIQVLVLAPGMHRALLPWKFDMAPELHRPGIILLGYDIGNVGWYTNATVIDMSGLVNGRKVAETKPADRLNVLIHMVGFPDFLVLTEAQADLVINALDAPTVTYVKTNKVVYSGYNVRGQVQLFLWTRRIVHRNSPDATSK